MRRSYIHTFIYERSFLACQTFQISNFTSQNISNQHHKMHTQGHIKLLIMMKIQPITNVVSIHKTIYICICMYVCMYVYIHKSFTCFVNKIIKTTIKSLASERCGINFKSVIFEHISQIEFMSTSYEIAFMCMPQHATDEKSASIQGLITWVNVDPFLCHHMSSLGHNELSKTQHIGAWAITAVLCRWCIQMHFFEWYMLVFCLNSIRVSSFVCMQSPMYQHWFKKWHEAKQAPSLYLNHYLTRRWYKYWCTNVALRAKVYYESLAQLLKFCIIQYRLLMI